MLKIITLAILLPWHHHFFGILLLCGRQEVRSACITKAKACRGTGAKLMRLRSLQHISQCLLGQMQTCAQLVRPSCRSYKQHGSSSSLPLRCTNIPGRQGTAIDSRFESSNTVAVSSGNSSLPSYLCKQVAGTACLSTGQLSTGTLRSN
jgi:hypothetical protein